MLRIPADEDTDSDDSTRGMEAKDDVEFPRRAQDLEVEHNGKRHIIRNPEAHKEFAEAVMNHKQWEYNTKSRVGRFRSTMDYYVSTDLDKSLFFTNWMPLQQCASEQKWQTEIDCPDSAPPIKGARYITVDCLVENYHYVAKEMYRLQKPSQAGVQDRGEMRGRHKKEIVFVYRWWLFDILSVHWRASELSKGCW